MIIYLLVLVLVCKIYNYFIHINLVIILVDGYGRCKKYLVSQEKNISKILKSSQFWMTVADKLINCIVYLNKLKKIVSCL